MNFDTKSIDKAIQNNLRKAMEQCIVIERLKFGLLNNDFEVIDQCIDKLREPYLEKIEALENGIYEQEKTACKYAKTNNIIDNLR